MDIIKNLFNEFLNHVLVPGIVITATALEPMTMIDDPMVSDDDTLFTVNQGDKVSSVKNGSTSSCTIGYVDAENRQFHIAEHCVSDSGRFYNENSRLIGKVSALARTETTEDNAHEDVAVVDLLDDVDIGGNPYSGDIAVDSEDISLRDQICMYGHTTKVIQCGVIRSLDDDVVTTSGKIAPQPGDSGGPAWIPGKGYVGVASTSMSRTILFNGQKVVTHGVWVPSHEFANDHGGNVPVYEPDH